jgi:hypothetical protein
MTEEESNFFQALRESVFGGHDGDVASKASGTSERQPDELRMRNGVSFVEAVVSVVLSWELPST